jgi:hypothetical protein
MALTAQHDCFGSFRMDGVLKNFSQSANMWQVMRGNAAESATPTVTLDFDFAWPDNLKPHWAAVTIQSAWRWVLCDFFWVGATCLGWFGVCDSADGCEWEP